MSRTDLAKEETTAYKVVVNSEEQYSIMLEFKDLPAGWRYAGKTGTKSECLAYVAEVWTDMRPLSVRKRIDDIPKDAAPPPSAGPVSPQGKGLVDRLSEGDHAIEVGLRPERTPGRFKEAIDRNYVHIRFTQTAGGTELGFRLNPTTSDFAAADFENGKGHVHLEGDLTLDSSRVRCIADIDLSTLEGRGRLVRHSDKDVLGQPNNSNQIV
jgi:uncharacterized protein YbdZ (MbtH family)